MAVPASSTPDQLARCHETSDRDESGLDLPRAKQGTQIRQVTGEQIAARFRQQRDVPVDHVTRSADRKERTHLTSSRFVQRHDVHTIEEADEIRLSIAATPHLGDGRGTGPKWHCLVMEHAKQRRHQAVASALLRLWTVALAAVAP